MYISHCNTLGKSQTVLPFALILDNLGLSMGVSGVLVSSGIPYYNSDVKLQQLGGICG